MENEIEIIEGGITNLQQLRDFTKSLPQGLRQEFIKEIMEERNNDIYSQEDMELTFISNNWDKLVEVGWLEE